MIPDTVNLRYLIYAPVLVGATALMFVKNIVYARIFSVESFGTLNQLLLCASVFVNFAGAGLQLLGHKLLPQYYTRREYASVQDLLASAIGVYGLAATLVAAGIGFGILTGAVRSVAASYAMLLNASAQSVFLLRLIKIKSELRFLTHASLSTVRAVLLLAAGVGVAALTRDVGATLAIEGLLTLLLAAPLFIGASGRPVSTKVLKLPVAHVWLDRNLSAGLRLLWLNGTMTLLYTIDRWAGIAFLSKKEYGIFALGLLVITVFETLQMVVNVAAYPLMGRMIVHDQYQRAFRLATVATIVAVAVTAVSYVPFILFLDFVVRTYLPLYVDAIMVIKLAVIAGTLRLADFYASFAVLCNEEERLAWAFGTLVAIVTTVILAGRALGYMRFNPVRMVVVTVMVSACGLLLNFAIAARARRRHLILAPV